ncbi:hypothetical protein PIB30_010614 [Stylosanthes scabra]|uniref:Exocyst subunit Exo70 family protein n=1 Tax=Stylosanthes scabra TaxID=79078 RepID=A0ABU6U477_9FABA|nr:hypothetical protein [Stylosanthes scabra]
MESLARFSKPPLHRKLPFRRPELNMAFLLSDFHFCFYSFSCSYPSILDEASFINSTKHPSVECKKNQEQGKANLNIILSFLILFAKKWSHSRTLRFKAHMACLVLTVTSVYSFYFDKASKGKPDAYSLISCAAFAVMSLSLSRQIQCGFEVDLLYFFLGALIIQLMKISLLLGCIGVIFSYALIILRSSLDASSSSGVYLTIQDQHHLVVQVDSGPSSQQANSTIDDFMPQLTACLEAIQGNNWRMIAMLERYATKYIRAAEVQNYDLPIPVDCNLLIDLLPLDSINNLHEAVELMAAAGFEKESCHAYSNCRREFLKQWLSYLMLRLPAIEAVIGMESSYLEREINIWIKVSNLALRLMFPNERSLCERVFSGFTSTVDHAFGEVCREFVISHLDFCNGFVAQSIVSKTLMFFPRVSKLFKTVHDLIPEYQSLFSDPSSDAIRNQAIHTWKKLGQAVTDIFKDLEDRIYRDRDSDVVRFLRGLYPISCDVMDCLSSVCESWNVLGLEKVFKEHPMFADTEGTSFSFSDQFTRIVELLVSQLEVESKNHTNSIEGCVFLINNFRYIENKLIECQSRMSTVILQDGTIRKLNAMVKQNLEEYQRSSWDKIFRILEQGSNNEHEEEAIIMGLMKKNIKLFNMYFRELCRVQCRFVISDEQLRKEMQQSVEEILFPSYGAFIGKFKNILGSHANEFIEYSMHDIDVQLNELFLGVSWELDVL